MDKKIKSILIGIGIATVALVMAKFVLGYAFTVVIVIGAFTLGALVSIIMIARSRGEKPMDVAKEVVEQVVTPDSDHLKHLVEEQLMGLNQRLRKETTVELIINAGEETIDLLMEVAPRAMEESPNSEAAFDLEKLSTDYLPDLLGTYLELSETDQVSNQDGILKQLRELADTIRAAEASMNEGNLDEFQISSSFLREKTA